MVFHGKRSQALQKIVYLPTAKINVSREKLRETHSRSSLKELAESISKYGVLQPISVRELGEGWELIAGERRLIAAGLAGMKEVPCVVLHINSAEAYVVALAENMQRRELHYFEEAEGIQRLMLMYGYSQAETAAKLGYSQSAIANKLRLLRLPEDVMRRLRREELTEHHARSLLRLPDESSMNDALDRIVRDHLNAAQTAEYIESILLPKPARKCGYVIKDVGIFMNTVERGIKMLNSGGVDAKIEKSESEKGITLRIVIPTVEYQYEATETSAVTPEPSLMLEPQPEVADCCSTRTSAEMSPDAPRERASETAALSAEALAASTASL